MEKIKKKERKKPNVNGKQFHAEKNHFIGTIAVFGTNE